MELACYFYLNKIKVHGRNWIIYGMTRVSFKLEEVQFSGNKYRLGKDFSWSIQT